mgnify:CR=1 FL=1
MRCQHNHEMTIAWVGTVIGMFVNLTSIPEPQAVEQAYRFVKPPDIDCPAVVSAGGENCRS